MPDIQVRTFVTNFESIFISHLQSGNRAVGCKEQGDNSPSKLWSEYKQNLHLQKLQ